MIYDDFKLTILGMIITNHELKGTFLKAQKYPSNYLLPRRRRDRIWAKERPP